jgi:hypothetical protein
MKLPTAKFFYLNSFGQRPPLWSSGQSSGYRSRGPSSIPGATTFSEK